MGDELKKLLHDYGEGRSHDIHFPVFRLGKANGIPLIVHQGELEGKERTVSSPSERGLAPI